MGAGSPSPPAVTTTHSDASSASVPRFWGNGSRRSAARSRSCRAPPVPNSISGCRLPDAAIRLVIADDHATVLKGLESLLTLEPDMVVVATCVDGRATLDAVQRHHPDVLLLDLSMP